MSIWEEGFYLEYIGRMGAVVWDILDLLTEKYPGQLPELALALRSLADECREAIEQFGLERENGISLDEMVDRIDARACVILSGISFEAEPDRHPLDWVL